MYDDYNPYMPGQFGPGPSVVHPIFQTDQGYDPSFQYPWPQAPWQGGGGGGRGDRTGQMPGPPPGQGDPGMPPGAGGGRGGGAPPPGAAPGQPPAPGRPYPGTPPGGGLPPAPFPNPGGVNTPTPGYAETGRNPFAMGPGPAGGFLPNSQWGSGPDLNWRNILVGGLGTLAGMATGIPFAGLLGNRMARRHFGAEPEFEGSNMFIPSYLPGGQDHGHLSQPGGYDFAGDAQRFSAEQQAALDQARMAYGVSGRGQAGFVQGTIDPASLGPYIPGANEGNIPLPQQGLQR